MSQAAKHAQRIRDQALAALTTRGARIAPGQHRYTDHRLEISYQAATAAAPHTLEIAKHGEGKVRVFNLVWADAGEAVVLVHRPGSWETSLRRLASPDHVMTGHPAGPKIWRL
jgi:hypothetical protein